METETIFQMIFGAILFLALVGVVMAYIGSFAVTTV